MWAAQIGIRGKLFGISVALMLVVGLTSGIYFQHELRNWLEQRIEVELSRHALAVRELVHDSGAATTTEIDALADRLAGAFADRITIIAPDGTVVGDSDLGTERLATVENHGRRPEVIAAVRTGHGQSRRYSTTIDTYMLYVAVPYGQGGAVRVARPLSEVDEAVSRLRALLLFAGFVGLVVAVAMSGLASHFMSRTLRQLAYSARTILRGASEQGSDVRTRVDVSSSDEIGKLAGSLNRMADDIESTVATLARERARFEAVLQSMSEAVIVLDDKRCIRLMNAAALELLGLPQAPIDEPLIDYVRSPAIHDLLGTLPDSAACELSLPGDRPHLVLARVSPERHSSGCVIVMHDITDIRHLETVRRDFVANVSHELRTPVSIIRANAETLLDGAMQDPVHGTRLLTALHRSAERLSSLISDLLDLSKIEAGRYPIAQETVAVRDAIRGAVESMEIDAEDKQITITSKALADISVRADARALDQILVNYLDNAIKYTPAGGAIELAARVHEGGVRIEVIDDGPGVPSHLHDRLFERFYRVDPGRSRDMGGTGLGLSIVKHLAEAMDGQAGVEQAEPHGSCFWVSLPRA